MNCNHCFQPLYVGDKILPVGRYTGSIYIPEANRIQVADELWVHARCFDAWAV